MNGARPEFSSGELLKVFEKLGFRVEQDVLVETNNRARDDFVREKEIAVKKIGHYLKNCVNIKNRGFTTPIF